MVRNAHYVMEDCESRGRLLDLILSERELAWDRSMNHAG